MPPIAEKSRDSLKEAIRRIKTDFTRSADTHLFRFNIPAVPEVLLYLKDESTHPTGSLKHRLAARCFCMACATTRSSGTRR